MINLAILQKAKNYVQFEIEEPNIPFLHSAADLLDDELDRLTGVRQLRIGRLVPVCTSDTHTHVYSSNKQHAVASVLLCGCVLCAVMRRQAKCTVRATCAMR